MSEPTTELDSRFSDPDAVATGWEETRRALEAAELFWISTVRQDGRPHVTPLVAVWLDDALHFCTGPTEQKAINLSHDANVTLTTGCNDWQRGLDVVVEGEAVPRYRPRAARAARRRVGAQVGRAVALHGGRRCVSACGRRPSTCVRGRAGEDPRVRQGHLQPHAAPVLKTVRASSSRAQRCASEELRDPHSTFGADLACQAHDVADDHEGGRLNEARSQPRRSPG